MPTKFLSVVVMLMLGAFGAGAQQTPPAGGRTGGGGGRQGGPGGSPPVPSISKRPSGAELGTIRVAAQDENIWFGWRVAIPTNAFRGMTFSEAAARADVMSLANVEVSSAERVAVEVPKPFDHRPRRCAGDHCVSGCSIQRRRPRQARD
jgi:hypothetical protein